MIVTDISHVSNQVSMTPALQKGIDFLRRPDIQSLQNGRIDLNGQRVFALVQRYETQMKDDPKLEYHRKYIDIQYIVSGEEVIGWAQAELMTVTEAYDPDRDICFGSLAKGGMTHVYLQAGQLAVLYPDDGHAPRLAAGRPSPVMKILVKVAVGE